MERENECKSFIQNEVEILLSEFDTRKRDLFDGQSVGITNAREAKEWRPVADAVNL